jgi:hypothetical protein
VTVLMFLAGFTAGLGGAAWLAYEGLLGDWRRQAERERRRRHATQNVIDDMLRIQERTQ